MSRKHFSWLLATTVLVAAVVLLVPGKTGKDSDFERMPVLPELQQRVNDLNWLRLVGAGDAVVATLRRSDGHWQVEELHGYRADWDRLRALLADLAQAKIVERKTANPDFYDRLGVEDVSAAGATGTRIEFAADSSLPAVIIGKRAEGRSGRYVRLHDAAESALIDRDLDLPGAREDWLEKAIVDIADTEVVEFEIRHGDDARVLARKISADDASFQLQDIPEGREITSDWAVDSLASSLSSLNLEAVSPEGEIDWSGAIRFGLVTADGLRLDAELARLEPAEAAAEAAPEHWLRLQAGVYQTAIDSAAESDPAAAGRAAEINARVTGWAYRIPKYKYDSMSKRMADLLREDADPDA